MAGQREVIPQGLVVERGVPFVYVPFFYYAPPGPVVGCPEVPLVVDKGLGLPGLEFAAGVLVVRQRSVALPRFHTGRRSAGLFHDVLGIGGHVRGQVALLRIQLQLGAVLQQLLQHLLGDGLALPLLVLVRLKLGQQLHHFRLEVAPEVHRLGES